MGTVKRTQDIFEVLSKGQFISSNSCHELIRRLFSELEENFPYYQDFFAEIGFVLEQGDEFFYFSRQEHRTDLERKIERAYRWIDILDFCKAFDNSFGPGYRFSPAEIEVRLGVDAVLKSKLKSLKRYTGEEKFGPAIGKLIDLLCREGFAELENEVSQSYKVLTSFRYLENLILSIHIPDEIDDEISE